VLEIFLATFSRWCEKDRIYTEKLTPCFRLCHNHVHTCFGCERETGGERNLLIFEDISLSINVQMKRCPGVLSTDMVIHKGSFRNNQITLFSCFIFIPNIIFHCVRTNFSNPPNRAVRQHHKLNLYCPSSRERRNVEIRSAGVARPAEVGLLTTAAVEGSQQLGNNSRLRRLSTLLTF